MRCWALATPSSSAVALKPGLRKCNTKPASAETFQTAQRDFAEGNYTMAQMEFQNFIRDYGYPDLVEQAHQHRHDEHHRHQHEFAWDDAEPHVHPHRHEVLTHKHPHYPDIHHRHGHSR